MKKVILVLAAFVCISLAKSQSIESGAKLSEFFKKSMTIDKFLALPEADFWKNCKSVPLQNPGFEDGHGIYAWPPAMKQFPKR